MKKLILVLLCLIVMSSGCSKNESSGVDEYTLSLPGDLNLLTQEETLNQQEEAAMSVAIESYKESILAESLEMFSKVEQFCRDVGTQYGEEVPEKITWDAENGICIELSEFNNRLDSIDTVGYSGEILDIHRTVSSCMGTLETCLTGTIMGKYLEIENVLGTASSELNKLR